MEKDIYLPPKSNVVINVGHKFFLGRRLAKWGSILQIAVIIGFVMFLTSAIATFQAITLYGTGDPKVMAVGISSALENSLIGCLVALPGMILSILAYVKTSYRTRKFFWYSIVASLFWILSFPWGTLFGILYLIFLITKRNDPLSPLIGETK